MTSATHSERESFVAELVRHRPQAQSHHIQRLMRYASGYWKLTEKQKRDLMSLSMRDQYKLQRIRSAVTEICEEIDCKPAFGHTVSLLVDTPHWQKILRVPMI